MTIVAIMIPTGGFQALAYRIADLSGGRQFLLLAMLGTAVTVIALLLDNVSTVVIFGQLIVVICQALRVHPVPYLLAAALLSDTGGVAALVGDPPNLMIGSAANIDFNTFLIHKGGIVFAAWPAGAEVALQQGVGGNARGVRLLRYGRTRRSPHLVRCAGGLLGDYVAVLRLFQHSDTLTTGGRRRDAAPTISCGYRGGCGQYARVPVGAARFYGRQSINHRN